MTRRGAGLDASMVRRATLDLSRPTGDQIADALKTAILSMRLPPGQMISENEIGQMFGASRTPVREAFAQLRDEGLIVTWPSRGTFVSRLSEDQIRGAQFVRETLEVAIVERLCDIDLPDAVGHALHDNLAQQVQAVETDDKTRFQALDDRFHAILAEAAGIERVTAVLAREKAVLDRLRVLALNDQRHMTRLCSEHAAIASAVQAGDAPQAVDRARIHLRGVLTTLSDLVDANRDYFDLAQD